MQDALSIELIRNTAQPLSGTYADCNSILDRVGEARFVLLGEATHGTHEFYWERAFITKRLIVEKNFNAVCVEADWPDAYRVDRYVHGCSDDEGAVQALNGFQRFPAWMWRNADVLDFVSWLRSFNESDEATTRGKTAFYGLDLYSLHASMQAVLNYLDSVDPEAAARARHRYACFENYGEDPQMYGYAAGLGLSNSCESEVVAQLIDLQKRSFEYARRDGARASEAFFSAEQNARLVRNAEKYYRTMFRGQVSSWNMRDAHMAETFDALVQHLSSEGRTAKLIIWAHNSHIGDARSTQMHSAGEWNLGQLIREKYPEDCRLIGFTMFTGTVTAASEWDGPAERKQVRPARPDSYEGLFHAVDIPSFVLGFEPGSDVFRCLREPRLERAIGVIYKPESELTSHYFMARLSEQFDAVLHFDRTRAVEPLERIAELHDTEPAETYPSGI
jgi:erythromycin esterase-like protein